MEKEKKYCSTFDTAKSQVNAILEKYGEQQVNLQSEAGRDQVCEEIMVSVAELNQSIFAQYIETVRFQAEINKDTEGGTPFDEQRKVILSDALWLEETGGFTGLSNEQKESHRQEVMENVAKQSGMVRVDPVDPVGHEGETGEAGEGEVNE